MQRKSLKEHLVDAIVKDKARTVRALLEKGADPNGYIDNDKLTPLFFAASNNALQSAFLLLTKGANPNVYCKGAEMTPVQVAEYCNYKEMSALLRSKNRAQVDTLH